MKKKITPVADIQEGLGYEHRPGIKNRFLKIMRRDEFLYAQYRDRLKGTDVSVTDKNILKNKMMESEAKYGYHNKIYHGMD